jgi:hypothetical protein
MVLNKSCKQLVADASEKIRTIPLQEAIKRHGDPDVVFVCVSCNAKA